MIQPKTERFVNSNNCAFTNTRNLAVMLLVRKLILPITNISKKYCWLCFCTYVCMHAHVHMYIIHMYLPFF